jgi:NAD(P)H-dependent nitrite reductase small subunit
MPAFRSVCKMTDLAEGFGRTFYVNDQAVAVFLIEGKVYAIDDTCPHMGASLGSGFVENGNVTCPWHFWRFRIKDGVWADNPRMGVACYAVRVDGDDVQVQLPDPREVHSTEKNPS